MAAILFFPTLIFMPIPIQKYYSSYSRSSHILKEVQRRVLLTVLPLGISVSLGDPFSCWQAVKSGSKHLEPASKQLLWRVNSHCLMCYSVCWCWHCVFNLFVRVTARENWMETLYLHKNMWILIAHDCHTNYLLVTFPVCCPPWASFYQLQSCLILLVCSEIIETFENVVCTSHRWNNQILCSAGHFPVLFIILFPHNCQLFPLETSWRSPRMTVCLLENATEQVCWGSMWNHRAGPCGFISHNKQRHQHRTRNYALVILTITLPFLLTL